MGRNGRQTGLNPALNGAGFSYLFFSWGVVGMKKGVYLWGQTNTHNMNSTMIYPELGQSTQAQIQYICGSYGGLYVRTYLDLSGRGITQTGSGADANDGRKSYRVTEKAFEKLEAKYSTCYIANL